MPEISLSTSFNILVVLLAALVSVALSYFAYRVTIPPIARRIRVLLTALRSVSLFFLFLLIAEPLLSLIQRTAEQPQTLVLVDNSRSMTITDKSGVRSEEVRSVLSSEGMRRLSDIGDVQFGVFDSRARFLPSFSFDSLDFAGDATDLSRALNQLKDVVRKNNVKSAVIISDGNSTSGSSPLFAAEELQIPVFTVGIGDTTEQRDLLIRTVLTNIVTYAGTRVPVNITVKSIGYAGQRTEVILRDSTKVIDRQSLTLESGERQYQVNLAFTPEKPGLQRYSVAVSTLPDELTDRNNRTTFFTKVMKSRMKVAILAGSPGADLAFIRRALEQDKNVEVTAFVEQTNGDFRPPLDERVLKDQDCLVLIGIPRPGTPTETVRIIAGAAADGLPFFFLASRQLDIQLLAPIEPFLPVTVRQRVPNEVQCFVQISDEHKRHVILRSRTITEDPWPLLPPLFQQQLEVRPKPESQVLAHSRIQNITTNFPAISVRSIAGQKTVAVMVYGLWRWKMMSDQQQKVVLDAFISNSIRWLTTKDDNRKIRVSPAAEFFSSRDPVEFVGQVYDDAFQPLDDARVTVTLHGKSQSQELALTSLGNGQYSGQWDYLPAGDYTYSAVIERDGGVLGRETGSFSVGDIAVEFLETQAHPLLLRQLAARTGGMYVEANQVNRLADAIRSTPGFHNREVVRSQEIELWNSRWSMFLLIVTFAAEWFLRKRFAMV